MSKTVYYKTGTTGGTSSDLDSVDGANLLDGDVGFVYKSGAVYFYELDVSSGASENDPSVITPDANPGNKRWILHGIVYAGETDFQGNYALQLQNIPDLASKGAGYWLDGVDDYITRANSSDIVLGIGDGSYIIAINSSGNDGAEQALAYMYDVGTVDRMQFRINSSGYLEYTLTENGTERSVVSNKTDIGADGKNHVVAVTIDRDVATGMKLYVDGNEEIYSAQTDITAITGNIAPTNPLYIGVNWNGSGSPFAGNISRFLWFNLNLTVAEVKAFSSGTPVPFKYIGASQTKIIEDDCADDDTGDWQKIDCTLTFDTDHYIITETAATQWTNLLNQAGVIPGKKCLISIDVKEGTYSGIFNIYFSDDSGAGTNVLIDSTGIGLTGDWVTHTFTGITTSGTDSIGINSIAGTGETWQFKNVSATQIGCVLQLEQPGIGHNQWLPTYGDMLPEVSGAIPTNLPANHIERYVKKAVTGETTISIPTGYAFVGIAWENTTANQAGNVNFGWSDDGQEIVADINLAGNSIGTLILLQRVAVLTSGSTDNVYISSDAWNGSSIDFYITLERIV